MSEAENEESPIRVYRADLNRERNTGEQNGNNQSDAPHAVDSDSECGSTISRSRVKPDKREPIVVNGPYSSCARYVFDCKHVVLIGGGIGITPYASILSSLMAQFRASRMVCKHCQGINYHSKGLVENRRLKKVDFIWVNRDQKNFEWFLKLLRQFEREQEHYLASNADEQRFLDIHLYFTEIKHEQNIGNAPLDLVTKVWAEVSGEDLFTSLKSKTHIGRPDWGDLFEDMISGENASTAHDVNVFFCGPPTMGQTIRDQCVSYRFRYYEENF
jgi:NADPH oxidase 5